MKMDWRPLGYWPVYKDGKMEWEKDIESIAKSIVDNAKLEVKSKYGNKKRHRQ
jgi:hypothetical protein